MPWPSRLLLFDPKLSLDRDDDDGYARYEEGDDDDGRRGDATLDTTVDTAAVVLANMIDPCAAAIDGGPPDDTLDTSTTGDQRGLYSPWVHGKKSSERSTKRPTPRPTKKPAPDDGDAADDRDGGGPEGPAAGVEEGAREMLDDEKDILYGLLFVISYMAVGVVAYSFVFESWGVVDSLYFSMVTLTTVGYGDVVPETQRGRFFTIIYATSGIVIIGVIVGRIGEQLADAQLKAIETMDLKLERDTMRLVQDGDDGASPRKSEGREAPVRERGFFVNSIFMPYVPLLLPFLLGAYVEGRGQGWTIVDLLYYAACTMTTVGYGDLVPASDGISRMAAAFFVPASAFALASMLGRYAALSARRRATRARRAVMDRGLRASDLDAMDRDGDGAVSRMEFVEFMLLSMGKVDREFLDRLHAQFDSLDKDGNGTLDRNDLLAKVRASQKPLSQNSKGAAANSYEGPSVV